MFVNNNIKLLTFEDIVLFANKSKELSECLDFLKNISKNAGDVEQIANLAFNILEKYELNNIQHDILYTLAMMTAGEECEFYRSIDEIKEMLDLL